MKKIFLPIIATSALLFAAGCNKNASMENQPTNAPAEEQSPMVNSNSVSNMETNNAATYGGVDTNSTGMDTNSTGMDMSNMDNSAATNNVNTTTNMSPP